MDFDYQKIKDAEFVQSEQRLRSQKSQYPKPTPQSSLTPETQTSIRKPPVKPRRSIKCHPTTQQGHGQSNNQESPKENEVIVKRIAPSQVLGPAVPLEAQTPSLRAHILLWFQKDQLPRLQTSRHPLPCWLHGFATRREAEQLLQDKQQGCFLLRLSESKIGFVLSYRGADRCRHFIIEEESEVSGLNGQYVIAGENSKHGSLEELINYYTCHPVGPFNETLTVPCEQPTSISDTIAKLGVRNEIGRCDEGEQKIESLLQSVSECSATDSTSQNAMAPSDSVQYAVVKKALKKSHSLPECKSVSDMCPTKENSIPELIVNNAEDLVQSSEAPYARVIKPPRSAQQNSSFQVTDPDHSLLGAAACADSQLLPSTTIMAEQKYWELEPLHTYEETLHIRPQNEEINFYAMGRHRVIERNTGDLPGNHVYSEVNIKGTRDDQSAPAPPPFRAAAIISANPFSSRPNMSMALRPPPRHAAFRSDSSVQSGFSGSPGMSASPLFNLNYPEHLQSADTAFSIYEQIPRRPTNSRPPLPPPNPKR